MMVPMSLRVIARATIKADKVDEAKAVFSAIVDPTRNEAGCIQYDLLQSQANPQNFAIVEEWESKDHLDAHLKSAHVAEMLSKLPDLADGPPDVQLYNQVL